MVDAFGDCPGGTSAGVAAGGFGGFGCNGNGGRGGDATASAAPEMTESIDPKDFPVEYLTSKFAFGGGGGYGIVKDTSAPDGQGGTGGDAIIRFGAPSTTLDTRHRRAIGGYGGFGTNAGGVGGSAIWEPEKYGVDARGNGGPGGQNSVPGAVPTHGTRTPAAAANATLVNPPIPQGGVPAWNVNQKYRCS